MGEDTVKFNNCSAFLSKERVRYQRKGFGIIVAALLTAGYLFGMPPLAQMYWP